MASKFDLDLLAERIRFEFEKSNDLSFGETDLVELWKSNEDISPEEKSVLIKNFATAYGFMVNVDVRKMSANFYVPKQASPRQRSVFHESSSTLSRNSPGGGKFERNYRWLIAQSLRGKF